ncbi:hypothetical protein [Salmon gill poxvirus]|nr:hypothetical protein [Salmon gill poxvirus]
MMTKKLNYLNSLLKNQSKKNQSKKNQLKKNQLKKNQLKKNQLKKNQLKKNQLKKNQLKKNQLKKNQLKKNHVPTMVLSLSLLCYVSDRQNTLIQTKIFCCLGLNHYQNRSTEHTMSHYIDMSETDNQDSILPRQ